jgi:ubiquinone/menaquinone biosynthesis C-methylase UbiE
MRSGGGLSCRQCGANFPVVNEVPLLVKSEVMSDTAEAIAHQLGGLSVESVERAFGSALRYRLNDATLRAEFSGVIARYSTTIRSNVAHGVKGSSSEKLELVAEYFNTRFTAGKAEYRSFRFRSIANIVLSSSGPSPFNISYWLTGPEGTRVEGIRSGFPIPLVPGGELTVPTRILPPSRPGRYEFELRLVQEFVGWDEGPPLYQNTLDVLIDEDPRGNLVVPNHKGYFDFDEDLRRSGEVYARSVALVQNLKGVAGCVNILEVACGSDPLTVRFFQQGTRVIASDLSYAQAQLGQLFHEKRGVVDWASYAFVAGDVFNAPFRTGSFDVIVICAALHHFSDAVVALRYLAKLLTAEGLLVILREPAKVFPEDETYLRELINGFNEQQFELAEYDIMFNRSGLEVIYEQLDFECSYKAIARNCSGVSRQ